MTSVIAFSPKGFPWKLACLLFAFFVSFPLAESYALPSSSDVPDEDNILFTDDAPQTGAPVTVLNGSDNTLRVAVRSWRDIPFQTVKRQALDYSCGSAALATLLTYGYGKDTAERNAFQAMFEAGDKEKIRHEGFSFLDMSRYLQSQGYKAGGYKISYATIEKNKVPFIALINNGGYNHFVVIKSLMGPYVLVGDPSRGNLIYTRDAFSKIWNGLALIITSQASKGRALFQDQREWSYAHTMARPQTGQRPDLDSTQLPYPNAQIAPTWVDPIQRVTSGLTNAFGSSGFLP